MIKIIIPYRDRPAMLKYWKNIPNRLIVELANKGQWNREVLFNVGVCETVEPFLVFNDIDHIPLEPYIERIGITQLATSTIQLHQYFGGVTMYDRPTILKLGGFHNDFWGGRGGDNEMRFNVNRHHLKVKELPHKFKILDHAREGPEFVKEMWLKAQQKRRYSQLQLLQYEVVERVSPEHIRVFIKKWK